MSENKTSKVYVVDDDDAVRDSLRMLFLSVGEDVETFSSANEFLQQFTQELQGVLVLDIRMPGMSGLELQKELSKQHSLIPIIFITGHGDVPMAVEAIKAGAFDFIQKPFRDQDLLDQVNKALSMDHSQRDNLVVEAEILERVATLTARETEVMGMIAAGNANKVVAIDLHLSQRTVEIHRSKVMKKMKVRSVAELVRALTAIGR